MNIIWILYLSSCSVNYYMQLKSFTMENNVGIILDMGSANERRRYIIMSSLIGWAHSQNDPCKALPILHRKFHCCWWPGYWRRQGISRSGLNQDLSYLSLSTNRLFGIRDNIFQWYFAINVIRLQDNIFQVSYQYLRLLAVWDIFEMFVICSIVYVQAYFNTYNSWGSGVMIKWYIQVMS